MIPSCVKDQCIWSPAKAMILFNVHLGHAVWHNEEAPIVDDVLSHFLNEGIVERDAKATSGWKTTKRGRALVEMILRTPYPVAGFVDGRTMEVVGL